MTGLAGFAGSTSPAEGKALLDRMLSTLQSDSPHSCDFYYAQGVGLGRVHLAFESLEPQPVWNEANTVCVLLVGELFGMGHVRQRLIAAGHHFVADSDAELVAHLFEEYGEGFVDHLNGSFAGAIWQPVLDELLLFNDSLGSRSLYYARTPGRIVFSSGVRALLADPLVPRTIDTVAVAQLLHFEYMLDSRTYFSAVKALTPGSLLRCRGGEIVSIRNYRRLMHAQTQPVRTESETLERLHGHMQTAFERQLPGSLPAGINLSGGLDSRMLLALWLRCTQGVPANTFTFGAPGADDVRLAGELAALTHSTHHYVPLRPDFMQDIADVCVRRTDGMKSCVHLQAYSLVPEQSKSVRVVYTGFLLDVLSTTDLPIEYYGAFDEATGLSLLRDTLQMVFRGVSPAQMYTEEFYRSCRHEFDDEFRTLALEVKDPLYPNWHSNFELRHSESRFTQLGSELLRGSLVCRTPFSDRDLVEACLAVPVGMRQGRHWLRRTLARFAPDLAKVPWERTGLPLNETLRSMAIRIDNQWRWYLRNRGANWVAAPERKPYQDYAGWMRKEMRGWVESTLLDRRALARGIVKPAFQRQLVNEHMNGKNNTRELGVLLAVELWHRAFMD